MKRFSGICHFRFLRPQSTLGGVDKPTVVLIGTGWGGAHFLKKVNPEKCNVIVLSQRNHMLFTPLLPQTCSGSLEFRSICEPLNKLYPSLNTLPNTFFRSMAYSVDFDKQVVNTLTVSTNDSVTAKEDVVVRKFDIKYDYLILAHGAVPGTFNIPGVHENTFFLREVHDARGIRKRLMQNIMTAKLPTTSYEEMKRLLHIVVVGGGPTGIEFAADMLTFINNDLKTVEPLLAKEVQVTVLEGKEILAPFDDSLRAYVTRRLNSIGGKIKIGIVKTATAKGVELKDGTMIPSGLIVWSTGVAPTPFTKTLNCDKTPRGRIAIDDHLRVLRDGKPLKNTFALGDCAAGMKVELPTIAAVASRQGKHVAKMMNEILGTDKEIGTTRPFSFRSLGTMCSLGSCSAVVDGKYPFHYHVTGMLAFLYWRLAYLCILMTVRTKLYVFVNWVGSALWGRDVTYISSISEFKQYHKYIKEATEKISKEDKTAEGAVITANTLRSGVLHSKNPVDIK